MDIISCKAMGLKRMTAIIKIHARALPTRPSHTHSPFSQSTSRTKRPSSQAQQPPKTQPSSSISRRHMWQWHRTARPGRGEPVSRLSVAVYPHLGVLASVLAVPPYSGIRDVVLGCLEHGSFALGMRTFGSSVLGHVLLDQLMLHQLVVHLVLVCRLLYGTASRCRASRRRASSSAFMRRPIVVVTMVCAWLGTT